MTAIEREKGKKLGKDLVVGDVLETWSGPHTITHFEPHPGLDGATARIACSGRWEMTVFDDDFEEIYPLRR